MPKAGPKPTGVERRFGEDELIVTKTDLKGRITYCNEVFVRMSDYTEQECLGQPHSLIRHPDMPRCVFKLLWDTIQAGKEIFAYVVNLSKNGDHYWVLAHVTPTVDVDGNIVGYHSNRRTIRPNALEVIEPLYAALRREEQRHGNRKEGMQAGARMLESTLRDKGVEYDQFIFSL